MQVSDLDFTYPPELVAVEPSRPTRVAFTPFGDEPEELGLETLLARVRSEDLFVVNDTRVVPARVFSAEEVEILFLHSLGPLCWEVLFPAREFAPGHALTLPGGVTARLEKKGLPQTLRVSAPLTPEYFEAHGEMAIPPYIQEARGERHNRGQDTLWYQSAWAKRRGSVAAPTASLHFSEDQLKRLPNVARLTLHVGAGTFLPVRARELSQHTMHSEQVLIPAEVRAQLSGVRARGGRVWALGTTAARALESMDRLHEDSNGDLVGDTKLFIYPPYRFQHVDVLLTNFHQPSSTLLALVAAFAGLENVRNTYRWAIERRFRLFSYGDLSAWTRA